MSGLNARRPASARGAHGSAYLPVTEVQHVYRVLRAGGRAKPAPLAGSRDISGAKALSVHRLQQNGPETATLDTQTAADAFFRVQPGDQR